MRWHYRGNKGLNTRHLSTHALHGDIPASEQVFVKAPITCTRVARRFNDKRVRGSDDGPNRKVLLRKIHEVSGYDLSQSCRPARAWMRTITAKTQRGEITVSHYWFVVT